MLNDKNSTTVATLTPALVGTEVHKVFDIEDALIACKKFFNALCLATGDPALSIDIVQRITEGITADPEFAQQVLTPENIRKAYALKAKADAGTIGIADIEKAFPIVKEKFGPFLAIAKTFM